MSSVANPRRYRLDLPGLHALFDSNYARLLRVLPHTGDRRRVLIAGDGPELEVEFQVCERAPYTTSVSVREVTDERPPWLSALHLQVRLYHDTSSAEVVEYQNEVGFWPRYRYPNPDMRQPDEKRQINYLLAELLQACISRGEDVTARPASAQVAPGPTDQDATQK